MEWNISLSGSPHILTFPILRQISNPRILATMKFAIVALLPALASAFAPAPKAAVSTALNLNGWAADETKFCFGLPGSIPPVGEFDPAGFAANADLGTIKKYREAELQHGRVAMVS
jgi:hypothetical protein